MNKLKGFSSLLLCGIIYGSFSIFIRLLSKDLTDYQQIALRNTFGFLFGLGIVVLLKQKITQKIFKLPLLLYGISFPLTVVFFTLAVLQTTIAIALFAMYVGSILASFLVGTFVFKEKVNMFNFVSIFFVLIGIGLFAFPFSQSTLNQGFLFACIAGLFDATSNSFRKHLAGKTNRWHLVLVQMIGGVLLASLLMLFTHQPFFPHVSPESIGIGILFGFLLVAVSYFSLVGFENFDLNLGVIIVSSELFFGPLFASMIFNEYLTTFELLGGLFISFAIVIPHIKLRTRK